MSLIAWYKFDETSGKFYSGAGDYSTGTLLTKANYQSGKIGNGLNFLDSTGIEIPATSITNTTLNKIGNTINQYSIALWIKSDGVISAVTPRIVEKISTKYPFVIREFPTTDKIFLALWDLSHNPQCAEVIANGGIWHHYCWLIDREKTIKLYKDGILDTTSTDTTVGDISATANLAWGNISGKDRAFIGIIDDFRIYDSLLSIDEITWLYNNGNGQDLPQRKILKVGIKKTGGSHRLNKII